MWLDKNRQLNVEEQKGLYLRILKAIAILFIGVVIAYFFTGWLYSSGTLTNEYFYNHLAIPSSVYPTTIRIMVVLLMVNLAQLLVLIGMALLRPEYRIRLARVTAGTQRPD